MLFFFLDCLFPKNLKEKFKKKIEKKCERKKKNLK